MLGSSQAGGVLGDHRVRGDEVHRPRSVSPVAAQNPAAAVRRSCRVHCSTLKRAPVRLWAREGPLLGGTALDHALECWPTSWRPHSAWGRQAQSHSAQRVRGCWDRPRRGREESDRASGPGHLGAATPNHGAWGPTACQAARARGQWPGASPVGACQDYPPPRLRTRLQVPRPSSQPEGVREVDMSSSQATGDCKQEAWLLAPAGLQPASPRGLSSLLQPRWPAGVWPGLGTQCLLKK